MEVPSLTQFCRRGHDRTLPNALIKNSTCRICHRLATKEWHKKYPERAKETHRKAIKKWRLNNKFSILEKRRRRREKFKVLRDLRKGVPCTDCHIKYGPHVMEFDHLGNKKFDISQGFNKSWVNLENEMAKCEVVCANCHRQRTHDRLISKENVKHGSDN